MTADKLYDAASTIMQQTAFANSGRRPGERGRQFASGGARGRQSHAAEQLRTWPAGR